MKQRLLITAVVLVFAALSLTACGSGVQADVQKSLSAPDLSTVVPWVAAAKNLKT